MEKRYESLEDLDLDLELKYYQMVPDQTDDPDVTWCDLNPSDEGESTFQPEFSNFSNDHKKIADASFKNGYEVIDGIPVISHKVLNDVAIENGTPTGTNDNNFAWWSRLSTWNGNLEATDSSNTEEYYKEIVKNHRKSTLASSTYGSKKESVGNYTCPKKWEVAQNSRCPDYAQYWIAAAYNNISTSSTENTRYMQSFSLPKYRAPIVSLNTGTSQKSSVSAQNTLSSTVISSPQRGVSLAREQDSPCYRSEATKLPLHPVSDSTSDESFTCENVSRKKLKKRSRAYYRSAQTEVIPCYRKYQLLGDSQLLRFSEQILRYKPAVISTEILLCRRLGYCVSGQKIHELEQRILKKEFKLSDKLILLIGTNDMVYNTELKSMCDSFDSLLNYLKDNAERIVVLTVPPVPRLMNDGEHMQKLKTFNQFVQNHSDEKKVFVVDLASLYISYSDTISVQFFERRLDKSSSTSSRKDLVHLNRAGFKLLKAVLDIEYFDKISSCYG